MDSERLLRLADKAAKLFNSTFIIVFAVTVVDWFEDDPPPVIDWADDPTVYIPLTVTFEVDNIEWSRRRSALTLYYKGTPVKYYIFPPVQALYYARF